jgi:hypothetical protein
MRPHHRGIHRHRPPLPLGLVAAAAQLGNDPRPRPVRRPASVPVIDRLPIPETRRQIPPRTTRPGPPQHPVDHRPVIGPPATPPRRTIRQQSLQTSPLPLGQIMTIKHTKQLPQPANKIHRTRPSRFVPHSQTIIGRSALEDDLLSVDRQPPRSQPSEVVGSTFGTASRVSSAPAAEAVHSSTQTLARAPLTTCFRSSVRLLP